MTKLNIGQFTGTVGLSLASDEHIPGIRALMNACDDQPLQHVLKTPLIVHPIADDPAGERATLVATDASSNAVMASICVGFAKNKEQLDAQLGASVPWPGGPVLTLTKSCVALGKPFGLDLRCAALLLADLMDGGELVAEVGDIAGSTSMERVYMQLLHLGDSSKSRVHLGKPISSGPRAGNMIGREFFVSAISELSKVTPYSKKWLGDIPFQSHLPPFGPEIFLAKVQGRPQAHT